MSRLDDLATRLEAKGCPDVLVAEDSLVVRNIVVDPRYGVFVEGVRITEETLDTLGIIADWQAPDQRPDAVTITQAMIERGAKAIGACRIMRMNSNEEMASAVLEAALAPETPDGN